MINNGEIDRPLDLLNNLKGKSVLISFANGDKDLGAKLIAFDIHINLVIEEGGKLKFIRGEMVKSVA